MLNARERRSRMWTRVFKPGTPAEQIEEADLEHWLGIPPDERLALVWELTRQQWNFFEGREDGRTPESGSPRSVASVRRR